MQVIDRISKQLAIHPIVLFMKGSPGRPMCQGSHAAVEALRDCGAQFHSIDVQQDPEIRAYLPKFCSLHGLPQLFLQGELIGSADIVVDLWRQGELAAMVAQCQPIQAIAS